MLKLNKAIYLFLYIAYWYLVLTLKNRQNYFLSKHHTPFSLKYPSIRYVNEDGHHLFYLRCYLVYLVAS